MAHVWGMILKRLALGVVTLFVVSILIFMATELLPGDFAQEILGQSATPETVKALREQLGLDQPQLVLPYSPKLPDRYQMSRELPHGFLYS